MFSGENVFRVFVIISSIAAFAYTICSVVSVVKDKGMSRFITPLLVSVTSMLHFSWLASIDFNAYNGGAELLCFAFLVAGFVLLLVSGGRRRKGKPSQWPRGLGIIFMASALILFMPIGESLSGVEDTQQSGYASVQQENAHVPDVTRQEIVDMAQGTDVSYKDILRHPDACVGEYVVIDVEIHQVMDGGLFDDEVYYFGYTDEEGYGWYMDDEYCLLDHRMGGSTKILEQDIVRVYGRVVGVQRFERALTSAEVELPVVEILYSDLIDE